MELSFFTGFGQLKIYVEKIYSSLAYLKALTFKL